MQGVYLTSNCPVEVYVSAIHMDQLTGGVRGFFGAGDHGPDFVRGGHAPAQRNAAFDFAAFFRRVGQGLYPALVQRRPAFRDDDGVDPYAEGQQFDGPFAGKRITLAVGRCIGGGAALAGFGGFGTCYGDGAPACFQAGSA